MPFLIPEYREADFLVMIFENLRDHGCEELAFFYDAIYMESKHNTVEEIRKKIDTRGLTPVALGGKARP